jgi:hypothetical protein
MSDTNLRPGVFDDTMPRRGIVKSNDLPHLEVVIADTVLLRTLSSKSVSIMLAAGE